MGIEGVPNLFIYSNTNYRVPAFLDQCPFLCTRQRERPYNSVSLWIKLCIYFPSISILWFQESRYVSKILESLWVLDCDISQKFRNLSSRLTLSFPEPLEKLSQRLFCITFIVVYGNGHLVANTSTLFQISHHRW